MLSRVCSPSTNRLYVVLNVFAVHRVLVMERKILHRDISRNNILINPIHNPDAMSGRSLISKPPWFIDDVLACEQKKWVMFGFLYLCTC